MNTHTAQKTKELLFPISDLPAAFLQGFFSGGETVSWHKTIQLNPLEWPLCKIVAITQNNWTHTFNHPSTYKEL